MNLKTTTERVRTELYELLWEYIHKYKFIRIILHTILQHSMPQRILNCREKGSQRMWLKNLIFGELYTRELKTFAVYEKMLYNKLTFFFQYFD